MDLGLGHYFKKKIQLMAYNYSEGNWKRWWSSYALI